jgi:hypothetical protein
LVGDRPWARAPFRRDGLVRTPVCHQSHHFALRRSEGGKVSGTDDRLADHDELVTTHAELRHAKTFGHRMRPARASAR